MNERNLIKQPLDAAELAAIARRVGGPEQLVAPKRRAEAEALGLAGDALIAWLAEDGGRVRRPIIDLGGKKVFLGFTGAVREELKAALG